MEKINIKTKSKEYDVIIQNNIIENIKDYIKEDNNKLLVIYDTNISTSFLSSFLDYDNVYFYPFKAKEKNKSFKQVSKIINYLLKNSFDKQDKLILIGGGVTIDVGAFVASIYKRGIEYISIPTTLLAMVDVCIGGKTGVNFNKYKNMVGVIYQPEQVIIDPIFLTTLDNKQFISGLMESLKCGIIKDIELFNLVANFNIEKINEIIIRSLNVKKYYIELDESDNNIRKTLNFGHTIGHALEKAFNFKVPHGICVGIGMYYEINKKYKEEILNILNLYHININVDKYLKYILNNVNNDKKVINNFIDIVNIESIGNSSLTKISLEEFKSWLIQ